MDIHPHVIKIHGLPVPVSLISESEEYGSSEYMRVLPLRPIRALLTYKPFIVDDDSFCDLSMSSVDECMRAQVASPDNVSCATSLGGNDCLPPPNVRLLREPTCSADPV